VGRPPVEELGWGGDGGEGVAKHGVAEGAGGGDGLGAGGGEFAGADVGDAFAGFSSPRKASPPPAPQQKLRSWLRGASTRVACCSMTARGSS
jgi:hypothetical protein